MKIMQLAKGEEGLSRGGSVHPNYPSIFGGLRPLNPPEVLDAAIG